MISKRITEFISSSVSAYFTCGDIVGQGVTDPLFETYLLSLRVHVNNIHFNLGFSRQVSERCIYKIKAISNLDTPRKLLHKPL